MLTAAFEFEHDGKDGSLSKKIVDFKSHRKLMKTSRLDRIWRVKANIKGGRRCLEPVRKDYLSTSLQDPSMTTTFCF
jgi:hypothetical protein